jgi:hypothetical protein
MIFDMISQANDFTAKRRVLAKDLIPSRRTIPMSRQPDHASMNEFSKLLIETSIEGLAKASSPNPGELRRLKIRFLTFLRILENLQG